MNRFNEVYKINSCCPDGVINRFVFNLCFFLAFFLYNSLFVVLTRSPSPLFSRSLLFFLPRRFQTLPIQTTRWMRSRTSQVQYRRGNVLMLSSVFPSQKKNGKTRQKRAKCSRLSLLHARFCTRNVGIIKTVNQTSRDNFR